MIERASGPNLSWNRAWRTDLGDLDDCGNTLTKDRRILTDTFKYDSDTRLQPWPSRQWRLPVLSLLWPNNGKVWFEFDSVAVLSGGPRMDI